MDAARADDRPTRRALSLEQALDHAAWLLDRDAREALALADAIVARVPGQPQAALIAGQALRRLDRPQEALDRLAALDRARPGVPAVLWEMAQAASAADAGDRAIAALEALTRRQPDIADGWFLLARELRKTGRGEDGWRADLSGVHAAARDRVLIDAAAAMHAGRLDDADAMLAARLEQVPDDPAATRLAGEVHWRRGDMAAALERVEHAVDLAPGFDLARDFLIRLLLQLNRLPEALHHADILAASPVGGPAHDLLRASVLVRLGDQDGARALYERLLAARPDQPKVWQNLGHALKTLGHQADAIHAYRQAVARQPTMGEAWWSLANLKTVTLDTADIAAMEQALDRLAPDAEARKEDIFHLHFSLGKALEDAGACQAAFGHYARGNALRRTLVAHDADDFAAEVRATAATFTAPFLAAMGAGGCPAPDPIFIVGLPRAGSTLVEQILSSHSRIEGTMELPDLMAIAARLQGRVDDGEFPDFTTMVASLTPADRTRLGEEYLDRTRIHRRSGKPLFIDKLPNNWQHVGLIHLILPNARILDARRHPMACCFSGWKQHFARGQSFSYDLTEIGRYYRAYAGMMAAFDAAMPGRVHRVHYEDMVVDTPGQVARLLDHLGLPFEEECLAFWRNKRAVRTASSEQVRQPIFTDGVDHWRRFAPWLGPLETALGPLATVYPDVPPGL
ncbi:putative Zn-dependent protease [Sphingobium sp. OAS761]|uniref:tetratricopeptide repeat-containing sulfotransferase family protein n=1 Tax=Sphingobium sp. OAS761 TaxID=2817901 RepID=UPI00209FDBED|nr:tetratricopeptide repeat-containing sulfotransferase family protein [Sphingobium sp. OAS761]MCP1469059.1 putative Zn-dependent protease [Sphingobium sp. OAS761]